MTQSHGSRVYTYMVREDSRAVKVTTSLVIPGDEETEGRVWPDVRIYPLLDKISGVIWHEDSEKVLLGNHSTV